MKKLSSVIIFILLALLYARGVESFPSGAPSAACDDLTPRPQGESVGHVDPAQPNPLPYIFNITPFDDNGTYQYTPGQTYTLTLYGLPGPRNSAFRGFFVQARMVADETTRVGTFGVIDTINSKLSNCPTNTDGITHTNRDDKTSISFSWTAPPQGTGGVIFRVAVVQTLNTFWANQRIPWTIAEAGTMTDLTTEAGNETTEAGNETTEAGNETTEAGNETTEAGNETTEAGNETTEAGNGTTEAGNETIAAGNGTTEAGNEATAGATHLTSARFWTILIGLVLKVVNAV